MSKHTNLFFAVHHAINIVVTLAVTTCTADRLFRSVQLVPHGIIFSKSKNQPDRHKFCVKRQFTTGMSEANVLYHVTIRHKKWVIDWTFAISTKNYRIPVFFVFSMRAVLQPSKLVLQLNSEIKLTLIILYIWTVLSAGIVLSKLPL